MWKLWPDTCAWLYPISQSSLCFSWLPVSCPCAWSQHSMYNFTLYLTQGYMPSGHRLSDSPDKVLASSWQCRPIWPGQICLQSVYLGVIGRLLLSRLHWEGGLENIWVEWIRTFGKWGLQSALEPAFSLILTWPVFYKYCPKFDVIPRHPGHFCFPLHGTPHERTSGLTQIHHYSVPLVCLAAGCLYCSGLLENDILRVTAYALQ